MRVSPVLFLFAVLYQVGISGLAADKADAGATSGDFLTIGVGARGPAFGEAYSAVAEGPEGLFYNPAGLTGNSRPEAGFMHYNNVEDISFSYLGFVYPLRSRPLAWGMGVIFQDNGDFDRVTLDGATGDLVRVGTFDAYDLALSGGLAYRLADHISFGGALKVIRSRIDDITATAVAADVGVLFREPVRGLNIAFVLQHLGSKLKFLSVKDNLPTTARVSAAYELVDDHLLVMFETRKRNSEEVTFGVGAEFKPFSQFAARVGYDFENDLSDGIRAGFGIELDNFRFDYAYVPNDDFDDGHRFSGTVMFGPPPNRITPLGTSSPEPAIEEHAADRVTTEEETGGERDYSSEIEEARRERQQYSEPSVIDREDELNRAMENVLKEVKGDADAVTGQPKTPAEAAPLEETPKDMRDADRLFTEGRYEEAIQVLKELSSRPNADFQVFYNLATSYYTTYRFALAAKNYRRALELKPDDPDAHLYLGYSYYQLGSVDRAIEEWRSVLRYQPDNEQARSALEAFGVSQ